MKKIGIALLAVVLAAAGLVSAPPAQAATDGIPVIVSPGNGAVFRLGATIALRVDFSDAPAGVYQLQVTSMSGTPIYQGTHDNYTAGETATFSLYPTAAGNYQFTTSDGDQSSPVAQVAFTVKNQTAPPPPPVIKRPTAPRNAHTTVASKKVRLHWAAPASNGGAAIAGYQVKQGATVRNLSAGNRSSLFTKLRNKRLYPFYVRARNRVGYGPWAHAYGKPSKPRKVKKNKPSKPNPPVAQAFANCTAMHKVYPHGVGLPGAVDNGGVKNFHRSAAIYKKNKKSDRDKDGIACEAD